MGEVTWSFQYCKYCVMIVDVLCIEEEVVVGVSLVERLGRIRYGLGEGLSFVGMIL